MAGTLFQTGLKMIIFLSIVFFAVFSYVCLMWTNRDKNSFRNILASLAVSLFYTFQIILLSLFFLGLVSFLAAKFFN